MYLQNVSKLYAMDEVVLITLAISFYVISSHPNNHMYVVHLKSLPLVHSNIILSCNMEFMQHIGSTSISISDTEKVNNTPSGFWSVRNHEIEATC